MEGAVAHSLEGKERTEDVRLKELAPFSKMLLSDAVRKGLQKTGFVYPTTIQATAIPVGKSGLDLLVQSKSGTGKTLIFCTILLEAYCSDVHEPQALIMAPTREIAVQIEAVLNQLGCCCKGFRAVCVIGGLDIGDDRKRLQGAKAVVGTPGRVLHLIQNDVLNTSQIRMLVLDEADKMYSQSFRQDLQRIQKALPAKRQTIACSATFCDGLDKELATVMRNPLLISTDDRATLLVGIKQFVCEVAEQKTSILEMQSKLDALRNIFGRIPFKQCLIFAGSQSRADSYRNYLVKEGWPCELISGASDQKTRLEMFRKFREFKTRIIVATDLMSRGVDSEHVNLVINLELPTDVVTYLHRIGRAGRFGSHGIAISFVASEKDRCTLTRLITQVGSGMNVLKYPLKEKQQENERDFWNFSDFNEDCKYFGLFGNEVLAPLASQDQISFSDSQDNKENQSDNNCCNSNSSIDTKTFRIDSKDSALNVQDMLVERGDYNAQLPLQKITPESHHSSSQQLPSSNTIDDASSIAADSLRSSQQDISRYQSVLMQKAAIPTLFEFLVDPSSSESKVMDGVAKQKRAQIDLFDDYKKTVLGNTDNSQNEVEYNLEKPLDAKKLEDFKSLLIDKPTQSKTVAKENDIYSDYANFNVDENSSSISQQTGTEEIDKATFILSVATPSNVQESIEELKNSSIDLSQSRSDSQSLPEMKHFPSPLHNQPASSIPDVVPPGQRLAMMPSSQLKQQQQKLSVDVGAQVDYLQIEIPPYHMEDSNSLTPADVASLQDVSPISNRSENLSNEQESLNSDVNTELGGSSGFNDGTTTSASSGIETSEVEQQYEEYDTSSEEDEGSDDETETESSGDNSSLTATVEERKRRNARKQAHLSQQGSNDALLSHADPNNSFNLAYQSAYAQWVDTYWNQMTLVQDYVKLIAFVKQQHDQI